MDDEAERRALARMTASNVRTVGNETEIAIGSVVVGVVAGAVASYVTELYFGMYALATGRIKILEYPAVQPGHWGSWDIWTLAISLAVGVMTTIFVARSLFKRGQAAVKFKRFGR